MSGVSFDISIILHKVNINRQQYQHCLRFIFIQATLVKHVVCVSCARHRKATHHSAVVLAERVCSDVFDSLQPRGLSPPSSPVHGILQARILEWVAICSSRASSQHRDQMCISCVGRYILYHCVSREAPHHGMLITKNLVSIRHHKVDLFTRFALLSTPW